MGYITQKYNTWESAELRSKLSIRQLQLGQKRVARAEEVSKEGKLCHSILPRLEGAVPKAAGAGSGMALGRGSSTSAQICGLLKKLLPYVCFSIAFLESYCAVTTHALTRFHTALLV